jgi:hypothetical protein
MPGAERFPDAKNLPRLFPNAFLLPEIYFDLNIIVVIPPKSSNVIGKIKYFI